MSRRSRLSALCISVAALVALASAPGAHASPRRPRERREGAHLEVTGSLGVGLRGTSGQSQELGPNALATVTGIDARLRLRGGHGVVLRFDRVEPAIACGAHIGLDFVDAAYAYTGRMFGNDTAALLAGFFGGLTVSVAREAWSLDRCPADAASHITPGAGAMGGAYDHTTAGAVVGGRIDVRVGMLLIGFGGDYRIAPVPGDGSIDQSLTLRLRLGFDAPL